LEGKIEEKIKSQIKLLFYAKALLTL